MKIHHATAKLARKFGIRIAETKKDEEFTASYRKIRVAAKNAKEAVAKVIRLMKSYEDEGGRESLRALQLAKPIYAERGDPDNCGDWLAQLLKKAFLTVEKKKGRNKGRIAFDVEGFTHCLRENDIEITGKWALNKNRGWRGRFRMNGRQKLEAVIRERGYLLLNGKEVKAPKSF